MQRLIERFFERGIEQILPSEKKLRAALASGKRLKFYLGADPSRPDLHIGHAVLLRRMRILQDLGHEIVFLIGDFTGRIGDPTGKDVARVQMTSEQVEANARTYSAQIRKIFDFEGSNPAQLAFNSTWLSRLSFEEVIRLSAKFTVQQMLERDMYQERLKGGKPIFLHEFLYPLLQGYDSVAMVVDGEFGGSDQLFNMMAGRTLVKDMLGKEKFVITGQLLLGTDGRKMSKSYDNYVALTDSPVEMFGKLMSIRDDLIIDYFTLCTDVELTDIARMKVTLTRAENNPRDLKMCMAKTVTAMYWGNAEATAAERAFVAQFQRGELPTDIPTYDLPAGEYSFIDILCQTGLAESRGDAKRLLKQGGVKIDGKKMVDAVQGKLTLGNDDRVLQVGKLRYLKLRPTVL